MIDAVAARKREQTITAHGKLGVLVGQHVPAVGHFVLSRGKRYFPP
jgi:hypothetical protein